MANRPAVQPPDHPAEGLILDTRSETSDNRRIMVRADLEAIRTSVDQLLAPLGKRVHSIVNYERFSCDDDVFDEYIDLVTYVEQTYYESVRRYTSGAFMRHKLGTELAKRAVSSEVLDPRAIGKA